MGHELADLELDVSFPCFPDVVTIWSSVSKHVRQQLLDEKVGSYPTPSPHPDGFRDSGTPVPASAAVLPRTALHFTDLPQMCQRPASP